MMESERYGDRDRIGVGGKEIKADGVGVKCYILVS